MHQRSVKSCDFEATIGNPNLNNFEHPFNPHFSHIIPITTAGDLASNDSFYEYVFSFKVFFDVIFLPQCKSI